MIATIRNTELMLLFWVFFACLSHKASAQTTHPSYEPDEMPAQLKEHPTSLPPKISVSQTKQGKGKKTSTRRRKKQNVDHAQLYLPKTLPIALVDSSVCARLDSAFFTFPCGNARIMPAFAKLSRILRGGNTRLNIIHIGDSHIQADIISSCIRHNLTSMAPGCCSDRGILFPFRAIGTNAPADYSIAHTGSWIKTWNLERSPARSIGISGAVATTSDPSASLTIDVKQAKWAFSALRILGNSQNGNLVPVVEVNGQKLTASTDTLPGYLFQLPADVTRCTITFNGSGTFELRGIIPMSARSGITYSAVGINGASCLSWIRCEKFEEELTLLHPDIAVVALGTNDANARTIDIETFKANYRRLLNKILAVRPDCFIIFTTNPDCYIGSAHTWCPTTPLTQRAFYELATEYNGAVFDIFAIQGGSHSTDRWVAAGLQQRDHVHFSAAGYNLLGNLFFNAFLRSYKEAAEMSKTTK